MADNTNGGGVPLTGAGVYDQDLYGGADKSAYVSSVPIGEEEEEGDERERLLARFCPSPPLRPPPSPSTHPNPLCASPPFSSLLPVPRPLSLQAAHPLCIVLQQAQVVHRPQVGPERDSCR